MRSWPFAFAVLLTSTVALADGPAKPAGAPNPEEALRKGVVQVEQAGRPIAVGAVLSRDGRILTSLSSLQNATEADVRYSDGSVVKAKVGHSDKSWDLVLLVPQTGRWLDGLMPTDTDPAGVDLKSFLPTNGKLSASPIGFKGRVDAKSKEGEALKSVLDLDFKGARAVMGAPVVEPNGKVVGVIARACKDAPAPSAVNDAAAPPKATPCTPVVIGVPVYALRGFLMKTPPTAIAPQPWLGLGGAPTEAGNVRGVRVMGIAPNSPAQKAGLKEKEDIIVAIDGAPVETAEQLSETIAKHAIGKTVKLLVFSNGKFREAPATLIAAPVAPPAAPKPLQTAPPTKPPASGGGGPGTDI